MDDLATDEDVTAYTEQAEDCRADCEIWVRAYDLEKEVGDEDERSVHIAVSRHAPAQVKRSRRKK